MNISFHLCSEADIEVADQILVAAYRFPTSRKELLRECYFAVQPDGWWLVLADGKPVGFGGAADYGTCCSIGMLSVLPEWQRQGIGTALVERIIAWCEERACPTLILEAGEKAVSLYHRLGFVREEPTLQMTQETLPTLASPTGITPLEAEDLPAVKHFDALFFGADRSNVLDTHWHYNPGRSFLARTPDGGITGYLIAQASMIGPWLASDIQTAEQLLLQALSLPFRRLPTVSLPASNTQGLALLQRYTFRQQGTNTFMRRGHHFPGHRANIYGQASPALG